MQDVAMRSYASVGTYDNNMYLQCAVNVNCYSRYSGFALRVCLCKVGSVCNPCTLDIREYLSLKETEIATAGIQVLPLLGLPMPMSTCNITHVVDGPAQSARIRF